MRTLAFLTSFYDLNGTLNIRKDFFKCLSENFNLVYIINSDELNFFPYLEKNIMERKIKVEFIISYQKILNFLIQKIVKSSLNLQIKRVY